MAKEKQTLESELAELATKRRKALEGLTRRDRGKMTEISADFHAKRQEIMAKYKATEEAPAEEPKKKKKKKGAK